MICHVARTCVSSILVWNDELQTPGVSQLVTTGNFRAARITFKKRPDDHPFSFLIYQTSAQSISVDFCRSCHPAPADADATDASPEVQEQNGGRVGQSSGDTRWPCQAIRDHEASDMSLGKTDAILVVMIIHV